MDSKKLFLSISLFLFIATVAKAERRRQTTAPYQAPVVRQYALPPAAIPAHDAPTLNAPSEVASPRPTTSGSTTGVPVPRLYDYVFIQFERAPFSLEDFFARTQHPYFTCMVDNNAFKDNPSLPGATMNPSNPVGLYSREQIQRVLADGSVARQSNTILELYQKVEYFTRNPSAGTELENQLRDAELTVRNLGPAPALVMNRVGALDCIERLRLNILREMSAIRRYVNEHGGQSPAGFSPKYLISTQLDHSYQLAMYNYLRRNHVGASTSPAGLVQGQVGVLVQEARARWQAGYAGILAK